MKSSITWCTVLGLVVGYFGIPVHPAAYTMWVWNRPYGFHFASILIFGSLGCLVGAFIHYWIWKRLDREVALWITAMISLALVFGTIGVFRYQAYNETVMWTEVNLGFVRAMAVSRDNVMNTDGGIQMTQAGADIQAGVTMAGRSGINIFGRDESQKLSAIASAFSEAGYYMVSQDKDKLQESLQFVKQSGAILRQMGNQSYPNKTNHLDEITSKIYNLIPKDFVVDGWQAN
jgi:hypothetical protein